MSFLILAFAAWFRERRYCCSDEIFLSQTALSRSNRSCCSSLVRRAARYSLFASANSRLSRIARTSLAATGSPTFFRSSATVPDTLTATWAMRSACGITVPGTTMRWAIVPACAVADSILADLISSSPSLTILCWSPFASTPDFAGSADGDSWALGAVPTAVLIRSGHCGKKLASAKPAARAPIKTDRRPIMPLALIGHLRCGRQTGRRAGKRLKIARDGLELAHHRTRRLAPPVCGNVEAMIHVIMDQLPFRLRNGLLNGVKLLRKVKAWTAFLEH